MRQVVNYIISPISAFAFFSAGTITTLTGPFGTYVSMNIWERAAYWYTLIAVSIVISLAIKRYVDIKLARHHFWVRAAVTSIVFTSAFAPLIFFMNWYVLGEVEAGGLSIWEMYFVVLSVPVCVNPLIYIISKLKGVEGDSPFAANTHEIDRARIFERLDPILGEEIIRMSVQDHLVHVYLKRGSQHLRMRFGDALAEVEGVPGLQIHRSHWVAFEAVAGHTQEAGKVLLKLKDGSEVPVSRNFRAEVEAAGLLSNDPSAPHAKAKRVRETA